MKKNLSRGEEIYGEDVFEILFQYEISRSKRYPSPLALLQIEMTPTAMNEEALTGAITVFTTALNSHLRSVDIPSKNGSGFRILLPSSNEHGARVVCDRLLSVFRNKFDTPNGPVAFSLQIGGTAHNGGPAIKREELINNAEEALRQAKLKGAHSYIVLA